MPFGLTSSGFSQKPQSQILIDMQTVELAQVSPGLDVGPTALAGVYNGIISADLADLWSLAGALYAGMDSTAATGDQLTGLALLTGTQRRAAIPTEVDATVTVTGAFSQAPGTMFASVAGNPTALFTNRDQVTFSGAGSGMFAFVAVSPGSTPVAPSTLTVISVPIANWSTITNPTAGVTGSPIETDPQLRLRRQQELSTAGGSTAASIQAAVLKFCQPAGTLGATNPLFQTTTPTVSCTVLFNDTDLIDGNGLLPHSIEVIAYQPGSVSADDQAVAELIAQFKDAGTNTNGSTSKTVIDSQGISQTINLTRPSPVTVNVAYTAVTNNLFGGNATIHTAITNYTSGNAAQGILPAWVPGANAFLLHTEASAFVPGVLDFSAFTLNGSAMNVTIGVRQVAVLGTITP